LACRSFCRNSKNNELYIILNNDYEGGNLCFRNPDGSGEWEVEVKPNRMIIWPSTFLYPHTVKPVTKGKRYSVVAWAL
jgi:predicted 2-oxoglutarate/Fe(II)-dependent dioxygenase YbiX